MKCLITGIAIISLLTAAACVKSNPAKTRVYTPAGEVEYHCPPGQRKKGHC